MVSTYKMVRSLLFVSFLVASIFYLANGNAVSFITKCKAEDTKCIKENAERAIPILASGIPELGVDSLDPVILDKIDASSPNLKLLLTNLKATGLKSCKVKKVKRDIVKSKIYMKVICSLELTGHYDMSGQILVLPIKGQGPAKVILRKAVFAADCNMDTINKPDGIHWHIKDWTHTFELQEKATLVFENLFDGNEVLAKAANEVIDNSTNEIILEIGGPLVQAMMRKVMDNINQFYKAVPGQDLALD